MNSRTTGLTIMAEQPLTSQIPRLACFLLLMVATVAWFWVPLATVVSLSLQYGSYEHHSHIVLIPLISLYLLYLNRRAIFATVEYTPWPGVFLMTIGVAWSWLTSPLVPDQQAALSPAMLSMVTACWGAFLLCYGIQAFRKASFGLLLLLFMVPIPSFLLEPIIGFLQWASAEATGFLFGVLGVPVFRQGFIFVLPGITIEVAESCSGIRSSLALLITSLVAGHLLLGSTWSKVALVLAVVPLTIVKNAVRIVVLSLLASYVHPSFITDSALHRNGGIPLFFVSLAALAAIVWLLRKFEARLGYRPPG
jgi:exosortase